MSLKHLFTTDGEMEDFEDGDVTTNVIGYVDAIIAPTPAGKKKELLFKFVLSNTSSRIEILVWGRELINKYYEDIRSTRIISINGGQCRAVANSNSRKEDKLVPFEIIVRENACLTFLGYYDLEDKVKSQRQKVTFDTIHTVEGLVEIDGYVRTPFALVHNRSGLMTYGLGAITDGCKKITVQVKQFAKSTLQIGDFVTIQGIVKGQDSLVTIFCENMDEIKYDPEKKMMSTEDIRRGGRAVKRVRSKEEK